MPYSLEARTGARAGDEIDHTGDFLLKPRERTKKKARAHFANVA